MGVFTYQDCSPCKDYTGHKHTQTQHTNAHSCKSGLVPAMGLHVFNVLRIPVLVHNLINTFGNSVASNLNVSDR